ncbi:MAG: cyclic nucleotide-binding domain-containing protein [Pirellulaceae bacterium]|nr:cyclic nucleotide-binding domain-containing protein [Pirellulaceae bacterium]
MADDRYFDELAQRWEEEGLFARDLNGQLIRDVAPEASDYGKMVEVMIDGQSVIVPRAVPTTDAQGNIIFVDASGKTVPRRTTIYDAFRLLCGTASPEKSPTLPLIPTLCHAEHLHPVGVCRVCSVELGRLEDDPKNPGQKIVRGGGKLVPACVQPVEAGMVVSTLRAKDEKSSGRVKSALRVLLELLASEHLPVSDDRSPAEKSDLARLVDSLGPQINLQPRRLAFEPAKMHPRDDSSLLIQIDHSACILCDRCSRSCTDVKHNFVIGRTGKGFSTRIGFDLNDPMGESSCVSCGECMLACPTTALTFRQPIVSEWYVEELKQSGRSAVTPEEMEANPLLATLPFRYRQWNQSSVVRWQVKVGDELCALGEHGSTAFILNKGRFGGWRSDPRLAKKKQRKGLTGLLASFFEPKQEEATFGPPDFEMTEEDLILGEMTCLNHYPRTATVRALTDGEVFIIRRNVLFTLQRSPAARRQLDGVYRQRAITSHLRRVPFFATLTADERKICQDFLQDRVKLLNLEPGQAIFRQGESADAFYMVRIGHVKVSMTQGASEQVLSYLSPDKHFGEIGLIADWPEVAAEIPTGLSSRRTASCTALDDVEIVRIGKEDFRELLLQVPTLKAQVVTEANRALGRQQEREKPLRPLSPTGPIGPISPIAPPTPLLTEFLDQGLYNAQKLLVLDLEACTRCDECTKACADTHGGVPRLIRDGLRFDKWLVASACRSCTDPYCLVGCPVDAIHRLADRKEILIESHCIGCGLCAANCPYGNINMHVEDDGPVLRSRATMCDLCHDIVGPEEEVSCVFACPHNAAFRMSGPELLERVQK